MAEEPVLTETVLAETVRRTWRANLDFYRALGGLTSEYVQTLRAIVGDVLAVDRSPAAGPARPVTGGAIRIRAGKSRAEPVAPAIPSRTSDAPASPPPRPALVLEAESEGLAGGVFVVGNNLPREVTAPVEISSFVAVGHAPVQPSVRIEPAHVVLEPGGQILVQVWVAVDETLAPGVGYRATIRVPGMSGEEIPVILRRRATATPDAVEAVASGSSRPARRRTSKKPRKTVTERT